MLPSNLLRIRVSKGKVHPVYAQLDQETLGLAERMIAAFRDSVGKKKGGLMQKVKEFENEGFDYRLVRALATLLERRCILEVESLINPGRARNIVFEAASNRRAVTAVERERVMKDMSERLGVTPEALEKSLWSDLEEELVLREFDSLEPAALIKYYNFSLTQTTLFKSLRLEFTASGNWKNIFRTVKWLGLMYSVEKTGEGYKVSTDGPLSLFKMIDRYGTSFAKLLPQITNSESWTLRAEIMSKKRDRVFSFELESDEVKGIIEDAEQQRIPQYDSAVEQRFAKAFSSCNTGWVLRREPEPLLAGTQVLIPDFSLEKYGAKVFLEIVGFWTQEYLERKVNKLAALSDVDILVAADEDLACSKLQRLKGRVIYYSKDVPLKPILDHLRRREELIVESHAESLRKEGLRLEGEVVSIEELAAEHGVPQESARRVLQGLDTKGYTKIGDYYIAGGRLEELKEKIYGLGDARLSEAERLIESWGLKNPQRVLEALGYAIVWEGIDYEKTKIRRTL
jgi:predicted nuclease of restriction endonuclease-like RecB superfamily